MLEVVKVLRYQVSTQKKRFFLGGNFATWWQKESHMTHRKDFCGKKCTKVTRFWEKTKKCHPILDGSFISNLVAKI